MVIMSRLSRHFQYIFYIRTTGKQQWKHNFRQVSNGRVFIKENIWGDQSDHLGQLLITPEMIAKKIKKMKDNKSPGVDGIPPKLLKEIVEQISTPLASVFH